MMPLVWPLRHPRCHIVLLACATSRSIAKLTSTYGNPKQDFNELYEDLCAACRVQRNSGYVFQNVA